MPAERRSFAAARPAKTERTHEENQERDRSLEARIESARRASEIHKKRTGRALRVTEQDVINEEMYEEEDDDLPAQYQRLHAHLQTSSIMFNKKLHDYIATQHGVRNMFMSQYQHQNQNQNQPPNQNQNQNQNQPFLPYGSQFSPTGPTFAPNNNWLNNAMLPPQPLSPSAPQGYQQAPILSPSTSQPPGFRRTPYHIPQRSSHQRSFSLQLPEGTGFFDPSASQINRVTTPQAGIDRRMSLPPSALEQPVLSTTPDGQTYSSHSQSPVVQSPYSAASPTKSSIQGTQALPNDARTPTSYSYCPATFSMTSQMQNINPLTASLPPESQQLIGSALDPNDPRTAIFMSGSDNLAQPFNSTYAYDSSFSKPVGGPSVSYAAMPMGRAQTLSAGLKIKLEPDATPSVTHASLSEGFYPQDAFLTPGNGDMNAFFDFSKGDFASSSQEEVADEKVDVFTFQNL